MSVREPKPEMVETQFGWALVSPTMPRRGETNIWMKTPERHIYQWDGDGWDRVSPPERQFLPYRDLDHG